MCVCARAREGGEGDREHACAPISVRRREVRQIIK